MGEGATPVERCLACEADGQQGSSRDPPIICLRSVVLNAGIRCSAGQLLPRQSGFHVPAKSACSGWDRFTISPCSPSASQARQRSTDVAVSPTRRFASELRLRARNAIANAYAMMALSQVGSRLPLRVLVPVIVSCALFMENLDATVLSTALPAIAGDLHQSPIQLKLALTSYPADTRRFYSGFRLGRGPLGGTPDLSLGHPYIRSGFSALWSGQFHPILGSG